MSDDATRIRQALRTIEVCWDDMLPDAPKATTAGTIGRTEGNPGPVPAHVLKVREEAMARAASWALVVADDLDLHPTVRCPRPKWHVRIPFTPVQLCGCGVAPGTTNLDHRMPATDVPALCRLLTIHADYLATIGDDPLEELEDSARKVDGIVDRPGPLEFVGRCEVCQGDLRARDGKAALCRDCGAMVDATSTRERLVSEAEDRLMTAAEIVAVAHRLWDARVTHVHLSRWVKSGMLATHGHAQVGERRHALHRVGDVGPLVERLTTRNRA